MRINTNVSSLTAQEAAQNTTKSITGSLEKLSTGLKINKASDDASGLAIADKLRTQATSINQGIANGNSAVALLQIADKSMAEQSNILDTVKAKLIQANTDTTSEDGREAIKNDIKKLLTQLDNIASQTNYNGKSLLQAGSNDSAASSGLKFQIGETEKDIINTGNIQSNTTGLGGGSVDLAGTDLKGGSAIRLTGDASLTASNGENLSINVSGEVGKITAGAGKLVLSDMDEATKEALTLIGATADATKFTDNKNGTFEILLGQTLDLTGVNIGSMKITAASADDVVKFDTDKVISVKNNLSDDLAITTASTVTGGDTLSALKGLDVLTKEDAASFQDVVNTAITELNGFRGEVGSTQNQVESAVRNLMTQATNVKAAESIIRDVDYAQESANFNKQNIIAQAGSYAISQANAVQQNVSRLLQ